MPLDTAALHMAEPTKPFPPKTTIYKERHKLKNFYVKIFKNAQFMSQIIQEWDIYIPVHF